MTRFERIRPFSSLIGRTVLGAIMLIHGWGKVIPHGSLYNFAHTVARLGLPYWLGYIAAFTEFFGGLALILGLLTPIAALAVAIEMTWPSSRCTSNTALPAPRDTNSR